MVWPVLILLRFRYCCLALAFALVAFIGTIRDAARFLISDLPIFVIVDNAPSPIAALINQDKSSTIFNLGSALRVWGT